MTLKVKIIIKLKMTKNGKITVFKGQIKEFAKINAHFVTKR